MEANEFKSTMAFDRLETYDSYDVYWLHPEDNNRVEPDDLYHCEYNFEDACKEIVQNGDPYINHHFEDETIEEWLTEEKE